jgi:hypothetical protein
MHRLDGPEGAVLREYYERASMLVPNSLTFGVMLGASNFVSIATSERLLASAYVVLLPVSVRYALRRIEAGSEGLALASLPLVYNRFFHMGFFSFCASLPMFVFGLAFWWRRQELARWFDVVLLAALTMMVYLCHAASAVMLMLVIGGVAAWRQRGVARAAVAFLPTVLLLIRFVGQRSDLTLWVPIHERALALYNLWAIADERTLPLSVLLASIFLGTGAIVALRRVRARSSQVSDGLLVATLGAVFLVLVAPAAASSGGFVGERLAVYPYILVICWLAAAVPERRRLLSFFEASGVVVSIALLSLWWPTWSLVSDYTEEYVSASDHIERNSTILPLAYAPSGMSADGREIGYRYAPFLHASGYLATRKDLVDLGLYEASTDHFPVRFRPERDPYLFISDRLDRESEPPRANFQAYPTQTGGRVDYVVLWQPDAAPPDHPDVSDVHSQLSREYERVYVSRRGLVHLFRRRTLARADSPGLP